MKGIIALDIDGTITEEFHSVPQEVASYLAGLAADGWVLVFITGRSYAWGFSVLKTLSFPYLLAVQNGAIILEMPSKLIRAKQYLDSSIFETMDEICKGESSDYVIYGGYEHDDICYYRPARFSSTLLDYLKKRIHALGETYQAVPTYAGLALNGFPSIKCFGLPEAAKRIAGKMEAALGLHVTPVRDPFDNSIMVAQATHPSVSKGQALRTVKAFYNKKLPVIAAGNDYNDVSMFALCDIKVIMSNSPADLLETADVVAPSVSEMGIIPGLQEAINRLAPGIKGFAS